MPEESRGNVEGSPETNEIEPCEEHPIEREELSAHILNTNEESKSNSSNNREPPPISFESICINDYFDVLDSSNRWCEGQVLKKDYDAKKVYISYLYWDSRFDEWIHDIAGRIRPLHSFTYFEGGELKLRQRIEVLDECRNWLESFVVDVNESKVKIHYKGYHEKFDEWIDRTIDRFRPYGRTKMLQQKRREPKQWRVPGTIQNNALEPRTVQTNQININGNNQTSYCDDDTTRYHNQENRVVALPQQSQQQQLIRRQPVRRARPHEMNPEDDDEYYENNRNRQYMNKTEIENEDYDNRKRKITAMSEQYHMYKLALERQNLFVIPMSGDGNCLFRSVAHQVYGNDALHGLVRAKCIDYMEIEAEFFSHFVEGGMDSFPFYLAAKRMDACWGDDPEIEAICELYNRPAEIWAFDPAIGARKLRTFHESTSSSGSLSTNMVRGGSNSGMVASVPMRLSYYGGGHYDSVVDPSYQMHLLHTNPGELEDRVISRSRERSNVMRNQPSTVSSNRTITNNTAFDAADIVIQISDTEATEQTAIDLALQVSRREHMNAAFDDLETCLLLSLQSAQQESLRVDHNSSSSSSVTSIEGTIPWINSDGVLSYGTDGPILLKEEIATIQDENLPPTSTSQFEIPSNDLQDAVIQGQLINSIQQQSELEDIEKEIINSLTSLPPVEMSPNYNTISDVHQDDEAILKISEDTFLEQLKKESAQEYERQQLQEAQKLSEDEMSMAIRLSSLDEQQAYELALQQSMHIPNIVSTVSNGSSQSNHNTNDFNTINHKKNPAFQTEDEMLQLALQASLSESILSNKNTAYNNNTHNTNSTNGVNTHHPHVYSQSNGVIAPIVPYDDDTSDVDEDLMLAIQASLNK